MDTLIKIFIFLFNLLCKFLPQLMPRNPEIAQRKYYESHRGKIEQLVASRDRKSQDAQMASEILKLLSLGNRFAFKANLAWGRSKISEYKAAWFNVLAAESYQGAKNHEQAGGYFHFAAHSFRNLGEYAIAGKYYYESANQFKKASNIKMALRACQRGISCYKQVSDDSAETYLKLFELKRNMANNSVERTR